VTWSIGAGYSVVQFGAGYRKWLWYSMYPSTHPHNWNGLVSISYIYAYNNHLSFICHLSLSICNLSLLATYYMQFKKIPSSEGWLLRNYSWISRDKVQEYNRYIEWKSTYHMWVYFLGSGCRTTSVQVFTGVIWSQDKGLDSMTSPLVGSDYLFTVIAVIVSAGDWDHFWEHVWTRKVPESH
jgi:hypothetical protein